MAKIGEAVGIVAAQSIGEPGTQLTMRAFSRRWCRFGNFQAAHHQGKSQGDRPLRRPSGGGDAGQNVCRVE